MSRMLLGWILLSGLALADGDPLAGSWEISDSDKLLRQWASSQYYYYPATTTLLVEPSLDKNHQYLVRWNLTSEKNKIAQVFTFWCDGSETKFRCLDRANPKQSFVLEFLSLTSAEVQDVTISFTSGYLSANYGKVHGLVRGGSQWLKLSNELYQDLKVHADEEKQTVEQWATKTLKGFSDLLKMPGAKGRGATFILDQSRNYYSETKK